jgi:hypothetical protein
MEQSRRGVCRAVCSAVGRGGFLAAGGSGGSGQQWSALLQSGGGGAIGPTPEANNRTKARPSWQVRKFGWESVPRRRWEGWRFQVAARCRHREHTEPEQQQQR